MHAMSVEKRIKGQTLRNTLKPIISPATSPTLAISAERSPGLEMDYTDTNTQNIKRDFLVGKTSFENAQGG